MDSLVPGIHQVSLFLVIFFILDVSVAHSESWAQNLLRIRFKIEMKKCSSDINKKAGVEAHPLRL